ncbi:unnamed protein product [Ectocarpus sp. 12 AP-2014]
MRARGSHGRGMPSGSMSRLDKKTQEGSRRGRCLMFGLEYGQRGQMVMRQASVVGRLFCARSSA